MQRELRGATTARWERPGPEPEAGKARLDPSAGTPSLKRTRAITGHLAARPRATLRVLVVDDSPLQRFVMRTMLRKLGVVAEEAVDGLDAIARASVDRFDIVLLDCRMPGLDGFATAEALSAASQPPWIAAVSADDEAADIERARAAGMRDYLVKPVDLRALARVLARASDAIVAPAREVTAG